MCGIQNSFYFLFVKHQIKSWIRQFKMDQAADEKHFIFTWSKYPLVSQKAFDILLLEHVPLFEL